MTAPNRSETAQDTLSPEATAFYRRTMAVLEQERVPFMVGGAYAFARYTGIVRNTRDFDLFIMPEDFDAALAALADAGYAVERNFPHWLGKAYSDGSYVDLIYGSGNGLTPVDEEWVRHAEHGTVLGAQVLLCPAEEMIWSKSFIMERERFDGADVAHLLHCCAERLDWQRLLARFGEHWRVLLSHLVLFGYIYPADAARVPRPVMQTLLARLSREALAPAAPAAAVDDGSAADASRLCRGTILSRAQYLFDLENHGYVDARLPPSGNMSADEIEKWTAAMQDDDRQGAGLPLTAPAADPPDR